MMTQAGLRSDSVICRRKISIVSRAKDMSALRGRESFWGHGPAVSGHRDALRGSRLWRVLAQRTAGDGEEDVVERGAGQLDGPQGEPGRVQLPQHPGERLFAAVYGQPQRRPADRDV